MNSLDQGLSHENALRHSACGRQNTILTFTLGVTFTLGHSISLVSLEPVVVVSFALGLGKEAALCVRSKDEDA